MNVGEAISVLGDSPFMIDEGRCYTYADLNQEVGWVGEALRGKGVEPGEVVALTGQYGFASAAWLLALAVNRNIVVPLVGGDVREVRLRLEEAGVVWDVKTGGDETSAQPSTVGGVRIEITKPERGTDYKGEALVARLREAKRAGLILFSSGSTGKAKGMIHDLDTLITSYAPGRTKGLRVLAFMGIDHIGGLDIFLRGIASGACLVVPGERSPEAVCRLIEEARVDVLPATPSFLNLMLLSGAHEERDLSSLKIIAFGAERMPQEVMKRLREVFPTVRFQQKFGTSETNAIRTVSKEEDPLWMRIDDPGVEAKIVDGELWVKTPSRILGYMNHETDRLTADGWYCTGDVVEEDGEGFFRIVGRRESMINVGGEKVVPGEVETVIRELAEVRDCRVFAVHNPLMGQVVGAEIVLTGNLDHKVAGRMVRKHCRARLAPHKVPVKIHVVGVIEVTDRFKRRV